MEKTRRKYVKYVVGRECGWNKEFLYEMESEKMVVKNQRACEMDDAIKSDKDPDA
jgi:hypothetical protein